MSITGKSVPRRLEALSSPSQLDFLILSKAELVH